ncbi:MAG: phosphoribosylaminoimidazole-succinocarboxamide synthase [Microgenomates group bacterium Gr01-1014_80]|nr:MAG: phosphoribosylaminoimidazole-succinocarboxamide synthase [Microgenomates group bacterium Gr01-1014_80]
MAGTENLAEVDRLIASQNGVPLMDSRPFFPGIESRLRFNQGKVRDNYLLNDGTMVMVASDRISTFDVVHPNGVPGKGILLTQVSRHLLDLTAPIVPNHLLTTDVDQFPEPFKGVDELRGRSMLVKAHSVIPFECIARGYISGSWWAAYKKDTTVLDFTHPAGMVESQQFPEPIFTPSTKETGGNHDRNVAFQEVVDRVGKDLAFALRDTTLKLYGSVLKYVLERGVILADTKFEFGLGNDGDGIVLIDEAFTSDSSRFWPLELYKPGGPQPSLDKQYVRDYVDSTGWNHEPPAPPLPERIVTKTLEKYREAYQRLTS